MQLQVRAANAPARAFYKHLGFAEAGVERGYYSSPADDAVRMLRPLQ